MKRFLETIKVLSDKEFQERIWLKGLGPECCDFDEVICDFFDDSEGIFPKYRKYGISEKQYQILLKFYKLLERYCDYTSEEGIVEAEIILKDPKWHEIQEFAKKVLKAFEDFDFSEKKE